jgi:hypothetical protein
VISTGKSLPLTYAQIRKGSKSTLAAICSGQERELIALRSEIAALRAQAGKNDPVQKVGQGKAAEREAAKAKLFIEIEAAKQSTSSSSPRKRSTSRSGTANKPNGKPTPVSCGGHSAGMLVRSGTGLTPRSAKNIGDGGRRPTPRSAEKLCAGGSPPTRKGQSKKRT